MADQSSQSSRVEFPPAAELKRRDQTNAERITELLRKCLWGLMVDPKNTAKCSLNVSEFEGADVASVEEELRGLGYSVSREWDRDDDCQRLTVSWCPSKSPQ